MKPFKTFLFIFPLTIFSSVSNAASGYIDVGIHFGGAKVDRIQLAGGNGGTDITSGEVLSASLGALFRPTLNTDIQIGGGKRSNTAVGQNGDVTWQSYFLETSAHYIIRNFRLGGGLQYYINPELRGGTTDRNFDNSIGPFVSCELEVYQGLYAGLRLTHEKYQDSATKEIVSGSTIGVTLTLTY